MLSKKKNKMKTVLSLFIMVVFILGINACKSSKESTENTESEKIESRSEKGSHINEAAEVEVTTDATANEGVTKEAQIDETSKLNQEEKYRIIVSFISWGEGIDPEARKIMENCMSENLENTEKEEVFEAMPWGREGEVDFCFSLSELNEEEQNNFVSSMQKTFEDNKLVQIYENSPAPHKR